MSAMTRLLFFCIVLLAAQYSKILHDPVTLMAHVIKQMILDVLNQIPDKSAPFRIVFAVPANYESSRRSGMHEVRRGVWDVIQ